MDAFDGSDAEQPTCSLDLRRVLRLAAAIVDAANRGRPNNNSVKVGGHQASSVPTRLSAQVRDFATGCGRNTGLVDAHSVALAGQ